MRTIDITIRGHVQGVGFRWAMRAAAEDHGVTGWVRNRRDGTVQARVAGTPEAVEAMIAWAHHGPPLARVERVDVAEADGDAAASGFEIRENA